MTPRKMIQVAVIGYGNIGKHVIEAIHTSPDMVLTGVVRRTKTPLPDPSIPLATHLQDLPTPDVAILTIPSRLTPKYSKEILALGIPTVDSFDIHHEISGLRHELDLWAKQHHTSAIISAGWDPGSDSIIRALLLACAPQGITYTNFGPGMSMGHSTAVKAFPGVKDALSITIPTGTGIHRRLVYIEVEDGVDFDTLKKQLLQDEYFKHDETIIKKVPSVEVLKDTGHGVNIVRKGVSSLIPNQQFSFDMRINNPALTAQILVSSARAVIKQSPGAYTLIEIPPIDLLPGNRDDLIDQLV